MWTCNFALGRNRPHCPTGVRIVGVRLITHLRSNYRRELWYLRREETQEFSFLVLFPGKVLHWEWWTLPKIRQYVQYGGLDDEKMLDGVYDFEFGEKFLVLVIEHVDGPVNQEAYFHRMSKVKMN
jgi:hypothetical protein